MAKQYKLWEILKMAEKFDYNIPLEQRPKFYRKVPNINFSNKSVFTFNKSNDSVFLCRTVGIHEHFEKVDTINIESVFELIEEEVDFLTAMKAYADGKKVFCKIKELSPRYYQANKKFDEAYSLYGQCLRDTDDEPISIGEILTGKWYIEQ